MPSSRFSVFLLAVLLIQLMSVFTAQAQPVGPHPESGLYITTSTDGATTFAFTDSSSATGVRYTDPECVGGEGGQFSADQCWGIRIGRCGVSTTFGIASDEGPVGSVTWEPPDAVNLYVSGCLADEYGLFRDESGGAWAIKFDAGRNIDFSASHACNSSDVFSRATGCAPGLSSAPGGVSSNLVGWWKADAGIAGTSDGDPVPQWDDQSGNANHAIQATVDRQPYYVSGDNGINFNPAIHFDYYDNWPHLEVLDTGIATTDSGAIFSVFKNFDGTLVGLKTDAGDDAEDPMIWIENFNDFQVYSDTPTENAYVQHSETLDSMPKLGMVSWTNGTPPATEIGLNGAREAGALNIEPGDDVGIGYDLTAGSGNWGDGYISEVVIYNGALTAAEKERIESYLAIKYGIEKSGDYLASDGTTIWTSGGGYDNDIALVGQDDGSGMVQAKSSSVSDDAIVSFENPDDLADGEFLAWGNDDGALTEQATEVPSGIGLRLTREWKLSETGETGNGKLVMDVGSLGLTGTQAFLLIDDDGDFSDATIVAADTYENGSAVWESIGFSGGQYFTLATKIADSPSPVTYYVSPTGGGNGTGWGDETDFQNALQNAKSGDSIYVLTGTYYPDQGSGSRESSFVIPDGAAIYGHFAGTETDASERDLGNDDNRSILSGDIGTPGDNSDNSFHVVLADGVGSDTLFDGFTVTGGNADGNSNPRNNGGGMLNTNGAALTISNCIFRGNATSNETDLYAPGGGGMYNVDSDVVVTDCIFKGNSAGWGGGMLNSTSDPTVINCIFSGNTAEQLGGGMSNNASDANIINCTFSGNSSYMGGGMDSGGAGTPNVVNTIFWNNQAEWSGAQVYPGRGGTNFANCNIQDSGGSDGWNWPRGQVATDNGGNIDADPLFVIPVDPAAAPSTAGNLHFFVGSPCIDTGNNDSVTAALDLEGDVRIQNSVVDMGAYEGGVPIPPAPGGVLPGLSLWLKADAGVVDTGGEVDKWIDQSIYELDFAGAAGTKPVFQAAAAENFNFNPNVDFNTSDFMTTKNGSCVFNGTSDSAEIFVVANAVDGSNKYFGTDTAGSPSTGAQGDYPALMSNSDNKLQFYNETGNSLKLGSTSLPFGSTHILGYRWAGGSNSVSLEYNGTNEGTFGANTTTGTYRNIIGEGPGGNNAIDANIAEIAVYRRELSSAERQKNRSYFAVKYGITLDSAAGAYVASDYDAEGTVWWNFGDTAGYHNDIAGIAKDTASGLLQPKSKSINDGSILTGELPSIGKSSLRGPTDAFPGDKFGLFWGHNGGDADYENTPVGATNMLIMNRKWLVEDNGVFVQDPVRGASGFGSVVYSIPASTGASQMWIDRDGDADFTTGTVDKIDSVDSQADPLVFSADVEDGQVFTFAKPSVPDAPGDGTATPLDENPVQLAWQDNSDDETGFKVERSPNGTDSWEQIVAVGADEQTYTDDDAALQCDTLYYYQVTATGDAGDSQTSGVFGAKTAPCPPSTLTADALSLDRIDLAWQDNSDSESQFLVQKSGSDSGPWTDIGIAGPNAVSVTDSGLFSCGTTYYYRVIAQRISGGGLDKSPASTVNSAPCPAAGATTQSCVPVAPTGGFAMPLDRNPIQVAWQDNSDDETGFKVERSPDGTGSWQLIATVGAGEQVYTDDDAALGCDTVYFYRVTATNAAGDSAPGSVFSAKTAPCPPSGLTAVARSIEQIDLAWQDNSDSESQLIVQRSESDSGPWTNIGTVDPDTESLTDPGPFDCGTTYYYQVIAQRTSGGVPGKLPASMVSSAPCPVASATTPGCEPGTPTDGVARPLNENKIQIGWKDNSDDETGFKVERSPDGTGSWQLIATLGPDLEFHLDDDAALQCGTTYFYRVTATSDSGDSVPTDVFSAKTSPCPPEGLVVDPQGPDQIDLSWIDKSDDESRFVIQRGPSSSGPWTDIDTIPAGSESYTDDDSLGCDNTYCYRVIAQREVAVNATRSAGYVNGEPSTPACGTTSPCSPEGGGAVAVDSHTATVTWTDSSISETSFVIEYRIKGSDDQWQEVTVPSDDPAGSGSEQSHDIDGLECETEYEFRVRAIGPDGAVVRAAVSERASSDYTDVFSCVTGLCAPSDERSEVTATLGEVLVEFVDNSDGEDHFVLEYGEISGGPYPNQEIVPAEPGIGAAIQTTLSDLPCGATYFGRIVAVDASGLRSAPTPEFAINTHSCDAIPTLGEYGLIFMALLLSVVTMAAVAKRRNRKS